MSGKESKRSGVALIIVLGLVAILMIVTVAFSIHMRVERAGAANLRHASEARLVVKSGMAAALAALDRDADSLKWNESAQAWGAGLPYDARYPNTSSFLGSETGWYNPLDSEALTYRRREGWYESGERRMLVTNFWKGTFVSYDTNALQHVAARIVTPEVEEYLPDGLAYRGFASRFGDHNGTPMLQPEWQPVYSDTDDGSVMGRYAFFVLDTSDMLDVCGLAAGSENRWMGKDPAEIQVSQRLLPEVTDEAAFTRQLGQDGPYVNLAEFRRRNEDSVENNASFNTFSYDPGPTNPLVYIGGDESDITRKRDAIIEAFVNSGLSDTQAKWAYLGLVDFVDENGPMFEDPAIDIKPWQRPVTETIPVMSGFVARFTVEAEQEVEQNGRVGDTEEIAWRAKDSCKMRMSADFKIPFVFPFVTPNQYRDISGLSLKARAEVNFETRWSDQNLKALIGELRDKFEDYCSREISGECGGHTGDNFVRIATNTDWKAGVPFANNAPPQLNSSCSLLFQAAGATYVGSAVQHRFPIDSSEYGDQGSEFWMTVPFGTADEDFNFADPEESTAKIPDGPNAGQNAKNQTGSTFNIKKWKASVDVWAEFLDPKFACKEMDGLHNNGYDENACRWYRTSHRSPRKNYPRQQHFDVPTRELATDSLTRNHFRGFNVPDNPFGAGNDDYGNYFAGVGRFEGASPLASYILTHPGVAGDLYRMNMDGIRNVADEDSGTADAAALQWRSYVKNDRLESVGELGYLPIGIWHTIRLYDYDDDPVNLPRSGEALMVSMTQYNHLPNDEDEVKPRFHTVLDQFTVLDYNPTGRINLNSLNKGVLATAFHRMPIATETGATPISSSDNRYRIDLAGGNQTDSRDLLAKAVLAYREDAEDGGVFGCLSDLGKIFRYSENGVDGFHGNKLAYAVEAVANAAEGDAKYGEFERESVVRNSCGLFTTRGKTFTIIVRGESYSPVFGRKTNLANGVCNAAKTAVAQVWRDTIPQNWADVERDVADRRLTGARAAAYRKENYVYPMFVKFFKIIDD